MMPVGPVADGDTPVLPAFPEEKRSNGPPSADFSDEKASVRSDSVGEQDIGDVYEDARAVDLDADGKERPIGTI
jgi:hypothetical protein